MATRRDFTFGSLVLALTGSATARAGGLAPASAKPAARLRWSHRARLQKGVLTVHASVVNTSTEPLEVVVARGPLPGAHLAAVLTIDEDRTELAPILKGDRRKVFMSRMGPIPEWAPLAAKDRLELGPYEFAWPQGVPATKVELSGGLDTEHGYQEFLATVLPSPATKATS